MSYNVGDYVQCERINGALADNFLTCPAMEETPAMDAIVGGQSEAGIVQEVVDSRGKVKTVRLVYENRLLESAVTSKSGTRGCTATHETFNNFADYTLDPDVYLEVDETFTIENLNTVCTDDANSMIDKKLSKLVDAMDRAEATKAANSLVASYGKWSTTAAATNTITNDELVVATLISAATKQIDDTALTDINMALKQTGYCGTKVIVGGSVLYKYGERINKGCCATTGVNILDAARAFGTGFAYDERVASALASESKSIVFQPGSVALLRYNTAPQVPNIGANYVKFRVASPRYGLTYDVTMKDDCGVISIIVRSTTKLVTLPTDMFAIGDKFRGVNFINKIKVENPE